MVSTVHNVTLDCRDPYELARWWAQVVVGVLDDDDFPGDPAASVNAPAGSGMPRLLFERVPEGKVVKNRMHLDLIPDTTRDQEVERLLGLGASHVADFIQGDGSGWVVLADPEGNEFCVERSHAERV